jgi:hypothetical protein
VWSRALASELCESPRAPAYEERGGGGGTAYSRTTPTTLRVQRLSAQHVCRSRALIFACAHIAAPLSLPH